MKFYSLIILILVFISCQQKTASPEIVFPPNESKQITIDEAALRIVAKDTKENVNADDIRVKRVKYLLTELSEKSSLSLNSRGNLVETSVRILEDKHGVKVTMQEFLEEMKKAKDARIAEALNQEPNFETLASLAAVKKGR